MKLQPSHRPSAALTTQLLKLFINEKLEQYHYAIEVESKKKYTSVVSGKGWEFAHQFFTFSSNLLVFCERKSDSLLKKSESLPFLFFHEQPEQITHGHSFVMSHLRIA